MKIIYILSVLIAISILGCSSGTLDDGLEAKKNADHVKAFKIYEPLALNGDAIAQAALGEIYYYGLQPDKESKWISGIPDYDLAIKWYSLSADQGNSEGQVGLAKMYYFGNGFEQDELKALELYLLAAKKENAEAFANLGFIKEHGGPLGFARIDSKDAMDLYRLAVKYGCNGDPRYWNGKPGCSEGIRGISRLYSRGLGVKQDMVTALMWSNLAHHHEEKEALSKNMTQEQIKEAAHLEYQCKARNVEGRYENC